MRHSLLLSLFTSLAVLPMVIPNIAGAQNYISAQEYRGADVTVNMGVLGSSDMRGAPVYSAPLQPLLQPLKPPARKLAAPLKLQPPVSAPQAPAPQTASAPPADPLMLTRSPMARPPVSAAPVVPAQAPAALPESRKLLAQASDGPRDVVKDIPASAPSNMAAIPSMDEMKTAMLSPSATPPSAHSSSGEKLETYRLIFDDKSEAIKPGEKATLDKIITKLNEDTTIRLQMRSYANGTPETTSAARRLSLMRALKLRDYLVERNIAATRLDIRALGKGSAAMGDEVGKDNAPTDRVDIVFIR